MADDSAIACASMTLARSRAPDRSFCPSEAARHLASDWRPLMPRVRAVAGTLPLVATQGGVPVDPVTASGPIRLRLAEGR
jgi:hypothetical protein